MREILFRAKRKDTGEWVEGFYFESFTEIPYIMTLHDHILGMTEFYEVDPATVGQFTGLLDKNSKRIFEGDILRYPPKDKWEEKNYVSFEVFYHDNDCADHHIGFQMNRLHFHGVYSGYSMLNSFLPKYTEKMVIIGTIHDEVSP